jgi:hypothetical protein
MDEPYTASRNREQEAQRTDDQSNGEGWLVFAGIVLMVAGVMRFFDAIWAWSYSGSVPDHLQDALLGRSLNTYGWVWLIIAIILFVSGLFVMVRSQVARWIGIVAGALGAVTAIWWAPYYPVWSLVYIVIGILVIYALAAHGQPEAEF